MEFYKKIEEIINQYIENEGENEDDNFIGGVSDIKISNVEKYLGIKFPEDYRWFLKRYGSGGIEGVDILGIEKNQVEIEKNTVVFATNQFRKEYDLNSNIVIIEYSGGYATGINTKNQNGKKSIVLIEACKSGEVISKSNSFCEYFLDKLKYMLEKDSRLRLNFYL